MVHQIGMQQDDVVDHFELERTKDLLELLHTIQISIADHHGRGMFRGMSDATWGLVPSAFRSDKDGAGQKRLAEIALVSGEKNAADLSEGFNQAIAEFTAVSYFYRIANDQGLPLPDVGTQWHHALLQRAMSLTRSSFISLLGANSYDWPPEQIRPVIALAQHYGVPTRLLDWSCDYHAAAYFAAKSAVRREKFDGARLAVWYLARAVVEATGVPLDLPEIQDLSYRLSIVEAPYAGNPNLAAQKGAFTLVTPTKKRNIETKGKTDTTTIDDAFLKMRVETQGTLYGDLVFKDKIKKKNLKPFMKVTLPASEARELLIALRHRGFDGARLFPGYKGCEIALSELQMTMT